MEFTLGCLIPIVANNHKAYACLMATIMKLNDFIDMVWQTGSCVNPSVFESTWVYADSYLLWLLIEITSSS